MFVYVCMYALVARSSLYLPVYACKCVFASVTCVFWCVRDCACVCVCIGFVNMYTCFILFVYFYVYGYTFKYVCVAVCIMLDDV